MEDSHEFIKSAEDLIDKRSDRDAVSSEKVEAEKQKILRVLASKNSDEVRIEILERLLKERLPKDLQKFALMQIASLHERKNWLSNAAKYYKMAAEISVTYREREDLFMKEVEMFIKAIMYNQADEAMKKAIEAVANPKNRDVIKERVIQLYLNEARMNEMNERRVNAIKTYEKVLSMIGESRKDLRSQIMSKLVVLYERVGKVRDSIRLRDSLKR
ncbi:hypothetical protein COS75_00940 [Candidatus Pacearchaeota archaeon CG06_land_8_20_14_3_00_35_12]|nr:MAG: hypothetical protein COS75_00940 [Candidatus Pacearchaeota archaeon CG06_land_8_20_14_3_00_35_12]